MNIASDLEDAFERLFNTAGDAFGVNSPEFVAIFDQVTTGLGDLEELTNNRMRSVEEINSEIERLTEANNAALESIDARIERARDQLSALSQQTANNTFVASQRLQELFEFIRSEYIRILEERFDQLEQVTGTGFTSEIQGLEAIATINEDQLVSLRNIEALLGNVQGFQHGTGGFQDFGQGQLAMLHGREGVFRPQDLPQMVMPSNVRGGEMRISLDLSGDINVSSPAAAAIIADRMTDRLARKIREEVATGISPGIRSLPDAVKKAANNNL